MVVPEHPDNLSEDPALPDASHETSLDAQVSREASAWRPNEARRAELIDSILERSQLALARAAHTAAAQARERQRRAGAWAIAAGLMGAFGTLWWVQSRQRDGGESDAGSLVASRPSHEPYSPPGSTADDAIAAFLAGSEVIGGDAGFDGLAESYDVDAGSLEVEVLAFSTGGRR